MADAPNPRFNEIVADIARRSGLPADDATVIQAATQQMVSETYGIEPRSGRAPLECSTPIAQAEALKAERADPKPRKR